MRGLGGRGIGGKLASRKNVGRGEGSNIVGDQPGGKEGRKIEEEVEDIRPKTELHSVINRGKMLVIKKKLEEGNNIVFVISIIGHYCVTW